MKGVTQRVYNGYRARKGQPQRSVRLIDLVELQDIYRRQYWHAVSGDDLPSGLDYAMFDYAVNSGPVRAIKDLQRVLGVKVDGHLGQSTLSQISAERVSSIISALCERRMTFLRSLKTFSVFGKGWSSRVASVKKKALAMPLVSVSAPPTFDDEEVSDGDAEANPPADTTTSKAEEADVKVTKKDGFLEKVLAGVSTAGAGIGAVLQGVDWRVGIALISVVAIAGTAYLVFHRGEDEKEWFPSS